MGQEMSAGLQEFDRLVQDARRICEGPTSTSDYEELFVQVLSYVKKNGHLDREFRDAFVAMVGEPSRGPWELIAFCMHELRWPEVLERAREYSASSNDPRRIAVAAAIEASYSDDWDAAELYEYYQGG